MRLRAGRLVQDSGQALIEYALILALASLAIISALMILQGSLGNSIISMGSPSCQRMRSSPPRLSMATVWPGSA